MAQIYYDMVKASDRRLIVSAAKTIHRDKKADLQIFLRPLGRFGKTTARLLAMRFAAPGEPATVSYVAKIDTKKNIERELNNANAVKQFFSLIPRIEHSETSDAGGILVSRNEGNLELKAILDRCTGKARYAQKILKIVLQQLPIPSSVQGKTRIADGFAEYLGGKREAGIKGLQLWSSSCCSEVIPYTTTSGVTWKELISRVDTFCDLEMEFTYGPIHGDLHLSNIIVDTRNNKRVTLIDFAWAQVKGIAAIDYAMLENSLRYMGTPHWLPEVLWANLDELAPRDRKEAKDHEDLTERKTNFLRPFRSNQSLVGWADTVWDLIVPIRSAAFLRAGISNRELLAARAALLLGQAKFLDYAPPRIAAQLSRLLNAVVP
ncbi:MAG: hypothetical protein DDT37_01753 [Firmicutes bacterium]|nr:hypothetical protein [candidate division NPL-UPA2 bacterium]